MMLLFILESFIYACDEQNIGIIFIFYGKQLCPCFIFPYFSSLCLKTIMVVIHRCGFKNREPNTGSDMTPAVAFIYLTFIWFSEVVSIKMF